MMFDQYNDIVTVKELCQMLKIGRTTAYILLHSKQIQSIRIGRKFLIPKAYIVSYLMIHKDLHEDAIDV